MIELPVSSGPENINIVKRKWTDLERFWPLFYRQVGRRLPPFGRRIQSNERERAAVSA